MSAWAATILVSIIAATGPLPEPVHVAFRCLDGRDVSGEAAGWDAGGVNGSFGRFAWADLPAGEAWHLLMQLIDADSAAEWSVVADVLSALPDGRLHSERARRWARWLESVAMRPKDAAAPVPESAAPIPAAPPATEAGAAGPAMHERPEPGSRSASAQPWPPLRDEEQERAVSQLRQESERAFKDVGLDYELYEGPYILLYTDLPPEEASLWLSRLYVAYRTLLGAFDLPLEHNVFWGKAVVIIGSRREQFVALERAAFNHHVPAELHGICHPIGPKAVVSFWRLPDDGKFGATMAHELAHAFIHRYRSDAPLPLWADEGFADYVAQRVVPNSPIDANRRERGIWFIRTGGPVGDILDIACLHEAWPGPHFAAQAVSYLLVRAMFETSPKRFMAWIAAIKEGKDWERALEDDYGLTRQRLIELFIRNCPDDRAGGGATSEPGR